MKIALISEGCYPFARGGVTTWCDQLVRGLPQHEFEVVALLADGTESIVLEVPDNVAGISRIPLWGPTPPRRLVRRRGTTSFVSAYELVLSGLLSEHPQALGQFVSGLRQLHWWAQSHDLQAALSSERATTLLLKSWARVSPHAATQPMSLRDALVATDLIEHSLRVLSRPAPVADLCHPVSNGLPTLVAMTAQWTHGTPMVMSEHGVFLRERYLALQDFAYGWPVKHVLLSFYRRLAEAGYAAADLIAPVNVFNQRWELRSGAHPDRIVTAYNGVDPSSFAATPEPDVPTIGWVGRIDPLKDLETLVRGFRSVRDRVPDARLKLFGPVPVGNEQYAQHIRGLVRRLDLDTACSFEGPVSPVTTAYQASNVVALTSVSEGLPYTVIEAMMSARATVSSDVGGVSEVVGETGLLFPAREPEEFSRMAVRLLDDPALRRGLALAGRERARGMFDLDRMLGAFGSMYAELPNDEQIDLFAPELVSAAS